jgi:hypothetical protein
MRSSAGAIEQLDEAGRDAFLVLLAVGQPDGSPLFITGYSTDRLEHLQDLVSRAGAAPIGIIRVVEKNGTEFEVQARTLKEFEGAPAHVREDAVRFLEKAVEAAADEITAFIQHKHASDPDG